MDTCGNGTAHTGINSICSTCDKPTCRSRAPEGVGCTQDLGHKGKHFNAFSLKGIATQAGPWEDPDYIPVKMTEDEIVEAKEWQRDMDALTEEMTEEYHRERKQFYYE